MNISSCVDLSPIVVSVPKNTKCLSGVDTSICLDAVGALVIIVALEFVASVAAEFHSNTSPSTIKQIALSPKLSIDHIPGSTTKSPDAASPQATKLDVSVIVAPEECDAAVVFLTPLVTPVKVFVDIPV
jgi:hypothetical protein